MQTKPALVIALSVLLSVWTVCATYLYRLRGDKPTDQTDRYQLKEYNQGKIVGLAPQRDEQKAIGQIARPAECSYQQERSHQAGKVQAPIEQTAVLL